MLKVFSLVLLILMFFQNGETYRTVLYANLTNYHIEPNNNVIEERRPRLFEWKKKVEEGPDGIEIYVFNQKYDEFDDLADLCNDYSLNIPMIIRRLLGIESCPIKKGTATFIVSEFSETAKYDVNECPSPIVTTYQLKSKKENKLVMTMDITIQRINIDCY